MELPVVQEVTMEDMEESRIRVLNPKQQRFVHMYLSGQYNIPQIAQLMKVSVGGIRKWLNTPHIKQIINEFQDEEDEIVRQSLKALRLKAMYKMSDLMESKIDGIAYQAARDVLDRTGHKAPTKNETKVEIFTYEQQLKEVMKDVIDVNEFQSVDENDEK